MRIWTEYMSVKNGSRIDRNYDFQEYKQWSLSRCHLSQTAPLPFEILPGEPEVDYICPVCSKSLLPATPGAPEGHWIGPVRSEIWPPWESSLTTFTQSQWQKFTLWMQYLHLYDYLGYYSMPTWDQSWKHWLIILEWKYQRIKMGWKRENWCLRFEGLLLKRSIISIRYLPMWSELELPNPQRNQTGVGMD